MPGSSNWKGPDHLPFVGDAEAVLAEVQDFLVGSRTPIPRQRRLLTLLFTDTAESVPKAVDLGDDAWRELLAAHDRDVRTHLTRFGGEEVKQLGNGVLAAFDGPARAIRCALGIVEVSEPKGLSVRVGVHTGECAVGEGDVRGIAVQVGARIVELAAPGRSWSRARSPTSSPARASVSVRAATSSWPACRKPLGFSRSCAMVPAPTPSAARRSSRPISSAATASTGRLAAEAGLGIEGRGEPVIDQAARAHYKRRITELEQELEQASEGGGGEAVPRPVRSSTR
jgi:hypothetical protein